MSPLLEEMPDRAEESFASLGKTPVGLTEGLIPLSAYADIPAQGTPYGRLFKGDYLKKWFVFLKRHTVGANIVRP